MKIFLRDTTGVEDSYFLNEVKLPILTVVRYLWNFIKGKSEFPYFICKGTTVDSRDVNKLILMVVFFILMRFYLP